MFDLNFVYIASRTEDLLVGDMYKTQIVKIQNKYFSTTLGYNANYF